VGQAKCWVNTTHSGGTASTVARGGTRRGFAMGVVCVQCASNVRRTASNPTIVDAHAVLAIHAKRNRVARPEALRWAWGTSIRMQGLLFIRINQSDSAKRIIKFSRWS